MRVRINRHTIVHQIEGWVIWRGHNKIKTVKSYSEAFEIVSAQ